MQPTIQAPDRHRMISLLRSLARQDGAFPTVLPGVQIVRKSRIPATRHVMDLAKLCYVAQGAKAVFYGGRRLVYNADTILVLPVSLPLIGEVVDAKPSQPMLSVSISLDLTELADVLREMPKSRDQRDSPDLVVQPITKEMFETLYRYVALLKEPEAIPALAPAIRRELYYRLLAGGRADRLRSLLARRKRVDEIGATIAWFRQHAFEPFSAAVLARRAHMSESSMYKSFKAVTSMSPLQFQKQLRLHEARRVLLAGTGDVASVSYRVGYKSPSQFSREYQRLFNAAPRQDIVRLLAQEQ